MFVNEGYMILFVLEPHLYQEANRTNISYIYFYIIQ